MNQLRNQEYHLIFGGTEKSKIQYEVEQSTKRTKLKGNREHKDSESDNNDEVMISSGA